MSREVLLIHDDRVFKIYDSEEIAKASLRLTFKQVICTICVDGTLCQVYDPVSHKPTGLDFILVPIMAKVIKTPGRLEEFFGQWGTK